MYICITYIVRGWPGAAAVPARGRPGRRPRAAGSAPGGPR